MFFIEQKVSRGKHTLNFWRTKRKLTETIKERCFSCQNKSVCQKLARSCKKWKSAKIWCTPFLYEALQLLNIRKTWKTHDRKHDLSPFWYKANGMLMKLKKNYINLISSKFWLIISHFPCLKVLKVIEILTKWAWNYYFLFHSLLTIFNYYPYKCSFAWTAEKLSSDNNYFNGRFMFNSCTNFVFSFLFYVYATEYCVSINKCKCIIFF